MDNNEGLYISYSQISDLLTCPCCKQKFSDPVSLPCGHLFCRGCISQLSESCEGVIKTTCRKCDLIHPERKLEDYETCLAVAQLVNCQPVRVTRGTQFEANIEKARKSANSLINSLKDANVLMNQAEVAIAEYISKIKAKVDLEAEKRIKEVQKERDEMLRELDRYRKECTDRLAGSIWSTSLTFGDYTKKCQETIKMVNKPDCDESEVIVSLKKIEDMKNPFEEWKKELEAEKLSCRNNVSFEANICSPLSGPYNTIGKLIISRINDTKTVRLPECLLGKPQISCDRTTSTPQRIIQSNLFNSMHKNVDSGLFLPANRK